MDEIAGTNVSVHNGSFTNDYLSFFAKDPEASSNYGAAGTAQTMLANRVSWFFDLTGPSVNMDSACSSSMMAFDQACQGLWAGDTTMVWESHLFSESCPEIYEHC